MGFSTLCCILVQSAKGRVLQSGWFGFALISIWVIGAESSCMVVTYQFKPPDSCCHSCPRVLPVLDACCYIYNLIQLQHELALHGLLVHFLQAQREQQAYAYDTKAGLVLQWYIGACRMAPAGLWRSIQHVWDDLKSGMCAGKHWHDPFCASTAATQHGTTS
jgi:hypothetical protein